MDISSLVEKYAKENRRGLWDKIAEIIDSKAGKWDRGIEGESQELTQMLVYEYATTLEDITKGKLSADFVVDKLSRTLGTLRIGDFKDGQDDHIRYNNMPVTSEGYKLKCRTGRGFGAHQIDYEENGQTYYSTAMYDKRQQYQASNGQTYTLTGGDLTSLDDICQTFYHEWTHVMEKCPVKASELSKNDVIRKRGDSIYINAALSPDLKMEEYIDFIENVDSLLASEDEIVFNGISTIEINERKSPNRRIMHNQISEGATELISKEIMKHLGRNIEESRYGMQADFVETVFKSLGMDEGISKYLTQSNEIISYIESKNYDGKDILRDADSFITALGNFENAVREMTRKAGNKFEFEKIKDKVVEFYKKGTEPTKDEIQALYEEIDSFAQVPKQDESYVRGMIEFCLTYPRREKEFIEEIKRLFPEKSKITSKEVIDKVKKDPNITEKDLQESSKEIRELALMPQPKITEEQKEAIEVATRSCIARMGEGKVPEAQIQGLLTRMYTMNSVKEAMESLAMNVSRVFAGPNAQEKFEASIKDIIAIDPSVYPSKDMLLAQLKKYQETNYTPGNISVEENHALISETLKATCDKLNELGVDYYVVGALSTFIKTGTPLFRYHGDLDFMVSEADLPKVQEALRESNYNFSDDRLDNKKRYSPDVGHTQGEHEVIANHKENEFHLGFFLFRREEDKSITVREYFMEEENGVKKPKILERNIPEELAVLEYSEDYTEFAGTKFRASTPESVLSKKMYTRHEKDMLDIEALEGKVDLEKMEEMKKYKTTTKVVDIDEVSKNIPKNKKSKQFPDLDD